MLNATELSQSPDRPADIEGEWSRNDADPPPHPTPQKAGETELHFS